MVQKCCNANVVRHPSERTPEVHRIFRDLFLANIVSRGTDFLTILTSPLTVDRGSGGLARSSHVLLNHTLAAGGLGLLAAVASEVVAVEGGVLAEPWLNPSLCGVWVG